MSEQLTIVLQRLNRIESMLAKVLHSGPEKKPKRIPEEEVIKQYNVGRARLKQLRLGFKRDGVQHDPVLFKWGHRGGRHIDYDVEELEQVFKRTIFIND